MATITNTSICSNSTLARFKAWAQSISNALSTFGWTKTSDTGQVNWTTIVSVPSSAYVYEVWKANDSLAATTPIYLRLEFGYSVSNPAVNITVGTGSDGAGGITGGVMGPYALTGGDFNLANQSATAYTCYFSGDTSEFRLMLWRNNSTACLAFGIERSKDTSGANTSEYVTVLGVNAVSTTWFQQTAVSGSVTPLESAPFTITSSSSPQTQNFAGATAAVPVFPLLGKLGNPMLGFYCAAAADVAEGVIATLNCYGANHSFVATKQGNIGSTLGKINAGSGGAMLMRYE